MKKQDIKDIVHQMICASMDSFDVSFDESSMSECDKEYAKSLFDKYSKQFHNKIKDSRFHHKFIVTEMVNIANEKENK